MASKNTAPGNLLENTEDKARLNKQGLNSVLYWLMYSFPEHSR